VDDGEGDLDVQGSGVDVVDADPVAIRGGENEVRVFQGRLRTGDGVDGGSSTA